MFREIIVLTERNDIPELLGELISTKGKNWMAVYTKPRREKKLADYAVKNNINYYLPLTDSIKYYQRKKVVYKKPVFSSYVFVRVNYNEKKQLIISGHTVCFLNVRNENKFLNELQDIYQVREKGMEIFNHNYIEKGFKVKFINGPLKGVVGKVTDLKNIQKVVLQVNILKRAIAVTADSSNLEVIDNDNY